MRKFTLYQASRFTKISRYKLEQAIQDGLLVCTEGKGNVKCYILEENLNAFLDKHGEQYRRFTYPEENKSPFVSEEINQYPFWNFDNYKANTLLTRIIVSLMILLLSNNY